jgi:hypothetical protein
MTATDHGRYAAFTNNSKDVFFVCVVIRPKAA